MPFRFTFVAPLLMGACLVGLGGCGAGVSTPNDGPDGASAGAGGSTGGAGSSGAAGLGGSGGLTTGTGGVANGGRDGGGGNAGSAGTGGSGGAAGTGAADAGACNAIVNSGPVAACSAFTSEPAASGGVIPDGVYQLESWQPAGACPLMVRETGRFMRTGANTYLVQAVADVVQMVGDAGAAQQGRTTFSFTTSGTTLTETFLCGNGRNSTWNYSVLTTAATTTLRVSNSTSMFDFVLAGP